MSKKLEAHNNLVIDYLHKLWNNPKTEVTLINYDNEKKYSLLQTLINNNLDKLPEQMIQPITEQMIQPITEQVIQPITDNSYETELKFL
jgi:hypothetical protein